jgi:GT2 family glycosyltransferase
VYGGSFSELPEKTEAGPQSSGLPLAAMLADRRFTHFILIRPDTVLSPDALFEFAAFFMRHPESSLIYSDDAYFERKPSAPFHYHFKPDFAPVSFRSMNYIGLSWCISRPALAAVPELEGVPTASVSSELIFRLMEQHRSVGHIPRPLFGYRRTDTGHDPVMELSAHSPDEIGSLRRHLERSGIAAEAERLRELPVFRLHYQLKGRPLISILIPNKDQAVLLKSCIDSILNRSVYRNFEIVILENGSTDPETAAYYRELEKNSLIRFVRCPAAETFNYSRLNNYGIRFCRGEYIVFLNNDVEVITPAWLEEMLMYAQREEIGAVGVKLFFPDHRIQHAGVLAGFMGAAEHMFLFAGPDQPGYAGQLLYARNCSAVTFACCMIRKSLIEQVRMDEDFALSFGDVDCCLQLLSRGYQIVWTPFAELFHYESSSRGYDGSPEKSLRLQQEICLMQRKWHAFLMQGDPFYNPNLSLVSTSFAFRHPSENRLIQALLDDFTHT